MIMSVQSERESPPPTLVHLDTFKDLYKLVLSGDGIDDAFLVIYIQF